MTGLSFECHIRLFYPCVVTLYRKCHEIKPYQTRHRSVWSVFCHSFRDKLPIDLLVFYAINGTFPELHLVLGQSSRLVCENILHLGQNIILYYKSHIQTCPLVFNKHDKSEAMHTDSPISLFIKLFWRISNPLRQRCKC